MSTSSTKSLSQTKKTDAEKAPTVRKQSPQFNHRGEDSAPHLPIPSEAPVPMSPEPNSVAATTDGADEEDYAIVGRQDLNADGKLEALYEAKRERKERKAENEARERIFGKDNPGTPGKARSRSPSTRSAESGQLSVSATQRGRTRSGQRKVRVTSSSPVAAPRSSPNAQSSTSHLSQFIQNPEIILEAASLRVEHENQHRVIQMVCNELAEHRAIATNTLEEAAVYQQLWEQGKHHQAADRNFAVHHMSQIAQDAYSEHELLAEQLAQAEYRIQHEAGVNSAIMYQSENAIAQLFL